MRVTSSLLLIALIVFGVLALAANAAYPVVKEREAKEKLAQSAKEILAPEIKRNTEVLATIEQDLSSGKLMGSKFDVAAWETVSKGSLLLGLDSAVISKLLHVYSLEYRANELSAGILDTYTGIGSSLSNAGVTREMLVTSYKEALRDLRSAVSDLSGAL